MGEILRDPLWQFVGAIVAVASFVFIILQLKRKELSYSIIINTPLLSIDKRIEDKITILYEDVFIANLQLIILRICNTGNTPIEKSDYERPISFSFGKNAFIFAEIVVDKKPENLKITFEKEKNKLIFDPILLNKKDEFSIKVFIKNYNGEINPDCRIVGVKGIKFQTNKPKGFWSDNWVLIVTNIFTLITTSLLAKEHYVYYAAVVLITLSIIFGIRIYLSQTIKKIKNNLE